MLFSSFSLKFSLSNPLPTQTCLGGLRTAPFPAQRQPLLSTMYPFRFSSFSFLFLFPTFAYVLVLQPAVCEPSPPTLLLFVLQFVMAPLLPCSKASSVSSRSCLLGLPAVFLRWLYRACHRSFLGSSSMPDMP